VLAPVSLDCMFWALSAKTAALSKELLKSLSRVVLHGD